jgi:aminoglycoside phosphotransferase (APT) family kinase protein
VRGPDDHRLRAAELVLDRLVAARPLVSRGTDSLRTEIIRDGAALVVRRGPFLVRVRPSTEQSRDTARREVRVASLLDALGVPVTPLVEPVDQPWAVAGTVVTAWSWVEHSTPSDAFDLGLLARTLRERSVVAAASVPAFDPLAATVDAVAGVPADDPEADFVRQRAAALAGPYRAAVADDPLGVAVVHGDLHRGNVVDGPGGPLLTDLELAGHGGASYDATPAVVAVNRYGTAPADLDRFLAGFASDPHPWPGFAVYCDVYELWVTAWAVGVRDRDPHWAAEASRRVATLRDGATHTWRLQ